MKCNGWKENKQQKNKKKKNIIMVQPITFSTNLHCLCALQVYIIYISFTAFMISLDQWNTGERERERETKVSEMQQIIFIFAGLRESAGFVKILIYLLRWQRNNGAYMQHLFVIGCYYKQILLFSLFIYFLLLESN